MGKRRVTFISFLIIVLLGLLACGKPADRDQPILGETEAHEIGDLIQSDMAKPNEQTDDSTSGADQNGFIWRVAPILEYDRIFFCANCNLFTSDWSDAIDERFAIRPFSGIPNDYPNYELNDYGYLSIYFPRNNPFFAEDRTFHIRLTTEISPYGATPPMSFAADYRLWGELLPRVKLFAVSMHYPQLS